jgi:hypothetical protein
MEKEPRYCLNCNKQIKSGRSDKKFCDMDCKDEYYNNLKSEEHSEIRKIELRLKKNRRILKKILGPNPEIIITKEKLLSAGFQFDYHTHHVISKIKSNEYIFCYDYGYHETRPGEYKIVKGFKKDG